MEELFLTIEQCKHLQELGLDMSDAVFGYYRYPITFDKKGNILGERFFIHSMKVMEECGIVKDAIPTYALQEILASIPFEINNYELFIDYPHNTIFYYNFTTKKEWHSEQSKDCNILNSAYKMLCWAIEKGFKNI